MSLSELGDFLNASALIVALVALLISIYSWRTADRAARNDVIGQVREWAGEVIDALSAAAGLCALRTEKAADDAFFLRRSELMSTFSSLLDRGRLFFPNTYREAYGTHKSTAFQGLRPQILDLVFLSHELTRSIDYVRGTLNDQRRGAFVQLKKAFVSAIQQATSFSAPSTLMRYEAFLNKTAVEPLPNEISLLAKAEVGHYQLSFVDEPLTANREATTQ